MVGRSIGLSPVGVDGTSDGVRTRILPGVWALCTVDVGVDKGLLFCGIILHVGAGWPGGIRCWGQMLLLGDTARTLGRGADRTFACCYKKCHGVLVVFFQ